MKKYYILSIFIIFVLSGCASYYFVHVNGQQEVVLAKFIEKLDAVYRGLDMVPWSESPYPHVREAWRYESKKDPSLESIWKSPNVSIVHNRNGNKLTIRVVAAPGMDEEAEVTAKYIEYLSKEFPELNVMIEKETTIDLR